MNRRHFLLTSASATTAALLPSCGKRDTSKTLTIFTWADYLSEDAAASFEEKHGVKLIIDTFDSNEAMIAKIESGATGYDLLVPSSYAVKQLQSRNLLAKLDHSKIPNLGNIEKEYLALALDPEMQVSVPYMMAPTVLAYLKSKVENPEPSWSLLTRPELKGRITLLDDMREVIGAALKSLGHSSNSTNPAELDAAVETAIAWKANIAKFENEQYKTGIASGEFHLVHGYAGDLMAVRDENPDIEIIITSEGANFPCDDLCIPASAKNPGLAHTFINHLLDAEVSAENMEWIGYRAPNAAAYPLLSEDFRGSEILFPPPGLFAKCETIAYLGDKLPLYTAAWEKIKNA